MWISKKKWESLEKRIVALELKNQSQPISVEQIIVRDDSGKEVLDVKITKEEFNHMIQKYLENARREHF